MGFQQRKGLRYEQSLSPAEYGKMRKLNRMEICKFLDEMKKKVSNDKSELNSKLVDSLSFLKENTFFLPAETINSGQKSS